MKSNKTVAMLLLAAAAGSMLTACSQDDKAEAQQKANSPEAITFAVASEATTRGGQVGAIDNPNALEQAGFGVFAFYSDNMLYTPYLHPNFMYNEKVEHSSGAWATKLVKYWPNEYGTNATTGDVDRLSFFAYAPYVNVTPANGQLTSEYTGDAATTGITRLSRATDSGDPQVHYVASFEPAESVDLVWGVVPAGQTFTGVDNEAETVAEGLPYLNLYKPDTEQKVTFAFQHALAALNVQVDATVDGKDASSDTDIDGETRIYVRSVSFEGFSTQGTLVLNNTTANTPLWLNYVGNATLPTTAVTVYDQRRDGHEAAAGDSNELPGGLNADLVQKTAYNTQPGVTKDAKNLFASTTATAPVYVIPNGAPLKVTIVYDVETKDDKLVGDYLSDGKTHGSVIENSITNVFNTTLEAGKKYALILHLGMTTAKFEGTVTGLGDTTEEKKLTVNTDTAINPGNALARRK